LIAIGLLALLVTLLEEPTAGAGVESDPIPYDRTSFGVDDDDSGWICWFVIVRDDHDGIEEPVLEWRNGERVLSRDPRFTYEWFSDGVSAAPSGTDGDGWDHGPPDATTSPAVPVRTPGPPRDLTARFVDDCIVLRWRPPLDDGGAMIEGYAIHRTSSGEVPFRTDEVGNIGTYDDDTVEEDVEYTYRVNAINVAGHGELSRPVTLRIETQLGPEAVSPAWLLLVAITFLALLKLLALTVSEPGRYRLSLMLAPLIIRGQKVLDHETRNALHDVILERPGIHYSALREEFGLSNGETAYHLSMLERENLVTSVRDGKLKRFYSVDVDLPKGADRSPEELRRELVKLIRRRPGINQMEVMRVLGMDRDCASYYLRNLVKEGRLVDGRDGRFTVYVVRMRD
jgi:predicted transcriptional regulator